MKRNNIPWGEFRIDSGTFETCGSIRHPRFSPDDSSFCIIREIWSTGPGVRGARDKGLTRVEPIAIPDRNVGMYSKAQPLERVYPTLCRSMACPSLITWRHMLRIAV